MVAQEHHQLRPQKQPELTPLQPQQKHWSPFDHFVHYSSTSERPSWHDKFILVEYKSWLCCYINTVQPFLQDWELRFYTYILQWGTLWTEWSFSACLDMLPFGKQEMYPRQLPNNQLHSLSANKAKEARKDRKSPNNTCYDTPWGSANSSQDPHITTLQIILFLHTLE